MNSAGIWQGGWASIILDENEQLVARLYQGMSHTTNNRMELRAIIETLRYFVEPTELLIVSDSQYALNGMIHANEIVASNDLNRPNFDLWFEYVELAAKHTISIMWVKGHSGNKWNEEADKWCTFAARCLNVPKDIWTITSS